MLRKVVKKKLGKQIHLITDVINSDRDTKITSFGSISELETYLVNELKDDLDYDFDSGNDIVIRGEILKVSVTETTYKVKIN